MSFTVSASFHLPFQHEYNGRIKHTTVLTETEKKVTDLLKTSDMNYFLRFESYRAVNTFPLDYKNISVVAIR